MIPALILTLAAGCGAPVVQEEVSPAVALEWAVREWALAPAEHEAELERAAGDADWVRRHGALDALSRAAPGSIPPEEVELALAALADAHPNVRAQALAVLARHGVPVGEVAEGLAADPFPEVRRELARALGRVSSGRGERTLLALLDDADPRVAREALDQLLARFAESEEIGGELWRRGAFHGDPEVLLHALEVMDRSRVLRPPYEAMRETYGPPAGAERSAERRAAREVLWNSGRSWGAASTGATSPAVGWLEPLGEEHSTVERLRRARLLDTAETAGRHVGRELLRAATEQDAIAQQGGEGAAEAAEHASFLLAGAVPALTGPDFWGDFARQGHSGPEPRGWSPDPRWSEDFAVEFWDAVLGRVDSWEPEDARWLRPEVGAEVAAAAIDAFADTWSRTLDPATGELLALALEDPREELASAAWVALARTAEGIYRFRRSLFAWWVKQPLETRLEGLRELTRDAPLDTPGREELVRLWASGEGRVVSVIELLGAHVGDEGVTALLWRWLDEELAVLEASPVPDEETTRGPWREAETRATWLAKAWLRATRSREVGRTTELLERTGELGKEVGKVLVADLAGRAKGRAALRERLDGVALSRRLRIEIVLVDETIDEPRAFDPLFEAFDSCDQELRLRIVHRLAGLAEARARQLLLAVALDREAGPGERGLAVDSLAAAGTDEEVEPLLRRVILESGDLDVVRSAVVALGKTGGKASEALLHSLLEDPDQAPYLFDVVLPVLASLEVRRGVAPTPRLVRLLFERARAGAEPELERRLRGERLSSRAFEYSGLLGAIEVLTRAGELDETLALAGPWSRLDARLLLELGATVAEAGGAAVDSTARRLNLAALIGVTGEGDAPDREGLVAKARARLLSIAWREREWREAEGWAHAILEDWRSGRTTRGGFEAVFGVRDLEARYEPTEWLLATELQARAWRALEDGNREWARELAEKAIDWPGFSAQARAQEDELEAAIEGE